MSHQRPAQLVEEDWQKLQDLSLVVDYKEEPRDSSSQGPKDKDRVQMKPGSVAQAGAPLSIQKPLSIVGTNQPILAFYIGLRMNHFDVPQPPEVILIASNDFTWERCTASSELHS